MFHLHFHATNEGTARGGLDFSHDMDIIIKIENHEPRVEKKQILVKTVT